MAVLLVLETLLQDECRQIAQGSSFLVTALNNRLKGRVRDSNRDSFGRAICKTMPLVLGDAHKSFVEREKHMLTPPLEFSILKKNLKEVLVVTLCGFRISIYAAL